MRITSNICNYNFKSNDRRIRANLEGKTVVQKDTFDYVSPEYGRLVYSNYTNFFRPDLNRSHSNNYYTKGTWAEFCQTMEDEYKNAPKVNVYDFACSDGSEAYSLIISLYEKLGEEHAQKYLPIVAYDIDETMVEIAKSGQIPLCSDDIQRFKNNVSNCYESSLFGVEFNDEKQIFSASDELKKQVQFNKADIKDVVETIEPSNSIVLCRNFWKYMSKTDMYETIWKLASQLDETSLLVIGDFDRFHVWTPLMACGFEEVYPLIYRKKC